MKKISHEEIVARQIDRSRQPKIPLVVILNDIRSLHNVGSIFRTADGIGVEKLWLCGITGYPPQQAIVKTALGAEESVVWEYSKDIRSLIEEYKANGYCIAVLEQVEESISHDEYQPDKPMCLIVGNEVDGVSEEVMDLCDVPLEIHMAGVKNSLNVGIAFGVVGYHLRTYLRRLV